MLYTVREFCGYVQDDLNGLIDEVAGITRYVSDEEKKAYAGSYPVVADMLVQAMKKQPAIGDAHISTTELLLEYKLPAASAWCDLVLLGANEENRKEVIIVELKNYLENPNDAPPLSCSPRWHPAKPSRTKPMQQGAYIQAAIL